MANSGSKSVTVTSWDTLKFSWWQVSQNVTNNTTVVGWRMDLIAGSSGRISSTASKDWSVTVNGTNYSGTNTIGVANNATKTLASGQTTIAHNADGTKSFSYSFSQEFGITFSGTALGTKSGSGTGTLNTIPRATTPTVSASSVDMGGKVTIDTPRASSSFTHDLAYSFAGSSYTSIATGVGTSYSWTVPDLASKIPNAASGTVTIRCITKSGSTTVGTKTVLLTAKVPTSVVPTISSVAVVEATAGLAAQFGAFIQGKSAVKATITAAGAKGSTIKAYQTTFQGKTYTAATFTSGTLTSAGTLTMTTKVQDSRGRWSAAKTTNVTVLAYSAPKISKFVVRRVNADGTANEQGPRASVAYAYTVTALGNKNTASVTVDFKRSSATSYAAGDVLLSSASLNGSATLTSAVVFSTDYKYTIRMRVTDWFGATATYTATLPSGAVIFDLLADGTGIAFFETCTRPGVHIPAGIPGSEKLIPDGTNLDALLTPGLYVVGNTASAATITNKPTGAGTSTALVEVLRMGDGQQLYMRYFQCDKDDLYEWARTYYTSAWGEWMLVGGSGAWKNLTLDSAFVAYGTNTQPKYKINGGLVTVTGSVKPVTAYTSSATKVVFASGLPTAIRPEVAQSFVCQGSGMNRWTCGIEPDGTLTISRYGVTENASVPTTAWLVFTCTYAV